MINQNLPFVLVASCIPVRGVSRSIICDLHRNEIKLIPNDLFDIIDKYQGKNIQHIKERFSNEFDNIIDEYFEFLLIEELIIITDTPELFPKLPLQWFASESISHAIIDIEKKSEFDIFKALSDLNEVRCKHLEVRFYRNTSLKELKKLIDFLNSIKSSIISIDFTLPYDIGFRTERLQNFCLKNPRTASFRVFNAPFEKFTPPIFEKQGYIVYSKALLKNEKNCGIVHSNLFAINIKTFTESINHNSCLNGKVSIDTQGQIKNCPSLKESYGHIDETSIKDAINHKDFKKYWNITKSQIVTCKGCEFRHVCTDCRAYRENPHDILSKPLKCGYNPETNEWNDWSKNPLKKKAISYYGLPEFTR